MREHMRSGHHRRYSNCGVTEMIARHEEDTTFSLQIKVEMQRKGLL